MDVKDPACVLESLESRAVSWKPHLLAVGSLIVTTRCCLTPAAYVFAPGNVTFTLPPAGFSAPTWHCDSLHVDSPGTPALPASGPAECAQRSNGMAPMI